MIKTMKRRAVQSVACLTLIATAARAADNPEQMAAPTLSPFSIGGDSRTNNDARANAGWIPRMAAIGITVARTPDMSWGAVEPEEGKWKWDKLDAQMSYLSDQHFIFGGLLIGSPKWNILDRPGTLPGNNLPGWSAYVTELVKHANRKIKYWEVWNEPPNFTGHDQKPADYAKIVVSAYDAAKAADPTCLVGLAAKSVHVNYLEQVIKAGARDHFDYIVLHPYETLGTVTDHSGAEPVYMHIAPTVRKMLVAQDPAKANVPIWFTELGYDAGKDASLQGHALVKAYTMGIAQGIACISWFEGMDGDSGPMGLLEANGTPRPAYIAMAQMIRYLGQRPTYLGWLLLNDKDYAFIFKSDEINLQGPGRGSVMIIWAPKGTQDTIDFGKQVAIVDPLTGTATQAGTYALSDAPVIVYHTPANLVTLAQDNLTKPFPWDGDYTNAKSVSVTFGETNVEKGLHTDSAASVAADVVAYGGSGRAGDIPGGNVFMVDPNFLTYTATPIEITVVVRRNPANDNAGFKLKYESTNGFKDFGWYTVPDNKEWHTKTWKINDAQFVSMWGYNFSLDSDGNQYNKYAIQSVTVTKLDK